MQHQEEHFLAVVVSRSMECEHGSPSRAPSNSAFSIRFIPPGRDSKSTGVVQVVIEHLRLNAFALPVHCDLQKAFSHYLSTYPNRMPLWLRSNKRAQDIAQIRDQWRSTVVGLRVLSIKVCSVCLPSGHTQLTDLLAFSDE